MEFFEDKTSQTSSTTGGMDTQVELVTSFFSHYTDEKEMDYYKSMIVDLYRAVTCFRMYDSLDEFMAVNPELEDCRHDIVQLWDEFGRLSQEDLAEVALELLKEI